MPNKLCIWLIFGPCAAFAQQPLSAIDWLGQNAPAVSAQPIVQEPPVTQTARNSSIETSPLGVLAVPVGLVPASVTGLPSTLWQGSEPARIARLLQEVPVYDTPALQTLLYTLLLTEADTKAGDDTVLLARLDRLLNLGAADPAQELVQQAGPAENAARFERWFDATLLTGDEDRSCSALVAAPHLAKDYAARIFCNARRGDWQTAALTLEAAHALEVMPQARLDLLDRFLSPDVFDGAPPLPVPDDTDPLTFRLFETIGEPLPTRALPRVFATADLRDVAGWKAQLEAAERLSQVGALTPNRLLGLYTERLPAASGGVWDRVKALQRFETALNSNSSEAVAKTLPVVWQAMQSARLEVPFAALFADQLTTLELSVQAAGLAWRLALLSPDYEAASLNTPSDTASERFLAALAQGAPGREEAFDNTSQAIIEGFSADTSPPVQLAHNLRDGALGYAILQAMVLFQSGATGNPADLSAALATFRAVGLEDTARRAALQLMLLERRG
ncbi:MAG: hypothetical protein AB8B51_01615 [Sedimentitalea sp.]